MAYQLGHMASRIRTFVRRVMTSTPESEARRTRDALVADAQARADHIRDDIDALLDELRKKDQSPSS
jgi:hypothetical protein